MFAVTSEVFAPKKSIGANDLAAELRVVLVRGELGHRRQRSGGFHQAVFVYASLFASWRRNVELRRRLGWWPIVRRQNRSVHRLVLVQPQQIISAPESRPWAVVNRSSHRHTNRPRPPTLSASHFVERCGLGAGDCRRRSRLDDTIASTNRTLPAARISPLSGRRRRLMRDPAVPFDPWPAVASRAGEPVHRDRHVPCVGSDGRSSDGRPTGGAAAI
jgi:hypothetical protein